KLETSASTACARSARAPLRKTSVSGSVKVPGCESCKTLVSVTAYHSFAGEVEASSTSTIRRLTLSRRHQLSPIAHETTGGPERRRRKNSVPLHRLRYRPPGAVGPSIAAAVATNSGLGDADDLRDLRDRFAVEVDEVDDLAALR